MTRDQAISLARRHHIPLSDDFHKLRSAEVERVLEAANEHGYRKPKNANGSRARYFFAYLQRASQRDE